MLRKILYLSIVMTLISLAAAGFYGTTQKNKEVNSVIVELNELTDLAVTNLGENPTLENIQKTQKVLEERKIPLKEKLSSLKLTDLERTNSDKANLVKESFDNNVNRFITIYQNLLKRWYGDLDRVNELREKYRKLGSKASYSEKETLVKEISDKRKAIETNIELLNALNETTETFKTIFTE
jgi:hypothetical protein